MGRKFSLEFGRKGIEGLNEEHDEGISGASTSEERDDVDIEKLMDEAAASTDDDFEDCKKDFSEELAKLMNDDDEIDEYYDDCVKEKALEEAQKGIDEARKIVHEIFD